MTRSYISGRLILFSDADLVPEEGISTPKSRLEFTLNPEAGENWMVVVEVLGSLPWLRGEEKEVKAYPLSEEFLNQLSSAVNPVYVLRGSKHVGMFELKTLNDC